MKEFEKTRAFRFFAGSFVLIVVGLFGALVLMNEHSKRNQTYFVIGGGGFILNYREAKITYGFTTYLQRPIEPGAQITAIFENPSGGSPFRFAKDVQVFMRRYSFRTPSLQGVEKDRLYRARLVVRDRNGKVLETHERFYKTSVAPKLLPDKPLVIGPGYTPNLAISP